jgi:hypothetical protein
MISDSSGYLIDNERSACLHDVGQADYLAAVAVGVDGTEHLVLTQLAAVGDPAVQYDSKCADAEHEQIGPLSIEFVRRLTISRRAYRCGRPTQARHPCRIRVPLDGDACGWHRAPAREHSDWQAEQ